LATQATYRLTEKDAGHRIRVLESAYNISGGSLPAASAATAMVRPGAAVAASRASLSGVAERRPRLAFTLTAGPGEPPLKAIAVQVASLFDVSPAKNALQHGIRADARGGTAKFLATITGRTIALKLRKSSTSIRVTISHLLITTTEAVARRVHAHKLTTVTVVIVVTETRGARTRLRLKVPVS
jgi:hypothetical protein